MKLTFKYLLIGLSILCFPTLLVAQEDGNGLGGDTTIVIKDKIPIVEDAEKLMYPALEPTYQAEKTPVKYESPVSLLKVDYEAPSIRPLAVSKEKPQKYPGSYVKLGFGSQWGPLAEIRHSGRFMRKDAEKLNYGAYFKHQSGYGAKLQHQDFSNNELKLYGSATTKKVTLNTSFDYQRNAVFYYGYNHADTSFKKKDVKQYFNLADATVGISRADVGENDFDYNGVFNFYYFGDRFKQNEIDANFSIDFEKVFKEKHFARLNLMDDYANFNNTIKSTNRNVFAVKPMYEYNDQLWKIFGGVQTVWENNIFHIFPDLGMERSLFKQYVVLYNGWKMELRRLGYRELAEQNPWVQPLGFDVKHTRWEDRFLGFKGTAGKFSYDLKFSQNVLRRTALFVNDSIDPSKFDVVYSSGRTSVLNPHAEFGVRVNGNLEFLVSGDYRMYELQGDAQAWHLPRWNVNFFTKYSIAKKIFLQMNIVALDGVFAKLPNGQQKQLNGTVDISIGATYKLSKYFSFFANLNNLASIKYQPFYNYPTYGFNGMAGVIFTYN